MAIAIDARINLLMEIHQFQPILSRLETFWAIRKKPNLPGIYKHPAFF